MVLSFLNCGKHCPICSFLHREVVTGYNWVVMGQASLTLPLGVLAQVICGNEHLLNQEKIHPRFLLHKARFLLFVVASLEGWGIRVGIFLHRQLCRNLFYNVLG